ncbi:LuxR C-terminal-related transcriptional regulator [Streptomyces sp. NPDC054796]
MIRVLLVHDVRLLRSGLAALVGKAHDMAIESTPWGGALGYARSSPTDVCVVDADSSGASALQEMAALPRFTSADEYGNRRGRGRCGVLALVSESRPGALRRALDARALGFVGKDAAPERLLTGIRHVAQGKRFIDDSLAAAFLRASEVPLTPRELSVLAVAAEGASVGEIARRLSLSDGTVRNYISSITRKTGARNRVDAIRISQGAGWL